MRKDRTRRVRIVGLSADAYRRISCPGWPNEWADWSPENGGRRSASERDDDALDLVDVDRQ
jgi:hypothetical protein